MEFCLKCDNMYYMKKNENNELIYHCNFCGDENEELLVKRNLKVYKYTKRICKRGEKTHCKLGSSYHFPKFTCRCKDANCKKTK